MKVDTMSRSQNFKSYGRGKHSNHPNTVVHSSIQFDKFFCENSNKPTAAKSAGTIGKWGITSFTSIRSSTFTVGHSKETSRFSSLGKKRTQPAPDNGMQIKRPVLNNNIKSDRSPIVTNRKFFKSRNSLDDPNQKSYKSSNSSEGKKSGKHSRSVDENKKQKHCLYEENKPKHISLVRSYEKPIKINTKKIPPLKISENTVSVSDDFHNLQNLPSPPKERDKPPIVLRIFKGTSQLISETGAKSEHTDDDGLRQNSNVDSRLEDNQINSHSGLTAAPLVEDDENNENVAAEVAVPEAPEPAITTRSLRRRSPEKPKSPTPEPIPPIKLSRRNSEKSKSLSPEPIIVKTRALRKRSPEKSKSPSPEPISVKTRALRKRSPEKSKSPSPEPITIKTRALRKHSPEKSKSPSPEPPTTIVKTRALRKRSPEKCKSPSPEPPTITTRSLRRRPPVAQPPAESVPPPQPHTSPKRVTRSAKNMAPPSKIVITNLNSDHPSVYINDAVSVPVPPLTSPSRREVKECRSYSNKHKHKQPSNKNEIVAKTDTEASLKKVEEILADIDSSPVMKIGGGTEDIDLKPSIDLGIHDTSLDSDRAELLQLLEDDDDINENLGSAGEITSTNADESAEANTVDPPSSPPAQTEEIVPVIINSNSELKIKIKISDLRKPSIEAEPPEDEFIPVNACSDSVDSGISVKSDSEPSSGISENSVVGCQNAEPQDTANFDAFKDVSEDRLTALADANSDSEAKPDAGVGVSCTSMQPTITNKKGSIFKHRSTNDGNKKRLALYKHKWIDEKDGANNADDDKNSQTTLSKTTVLDSFLDADVDDMPLTKFIRQPSENKFEFDEPAPITGVKCSKKNKDFYTVVRNVKKAHQIQESGEFQEFNDDVEYILDALQDNNPIGTRCLSAITLATKCTEPAFRMHVRAHGTVTKFFRALHDATKDQSLGLCTATVMFVLSQDRLNMDLDRDSLELMLNLLESDASHTKALEDCGLTDSQLTKTRDRVRQICADIQSQGHAKHLNLDNITVGHLSMETLLSLTSKRAGEWFKEELRELGGLEHIIKTVVECCKHVDDTANAWSATSLEKIRKVDRCLRVLENVTMLNEQNNYYLLDYQNGILIDTLVRMYKVCDYEIPLYPTYTIGDKESTGAILRECLIANLKVLINITHDYQNKSQGSSVIGNRPGFIESSLHVLLQVPQYIPKEEKFDLMLLTLILLINLVEHYDSNRKAIIEAKAPTDEESIFETKAREPAVKALISMFYNYEELARNEEKKTDAILEGENTEKPPTNAPQKAHEDFIEETISQLVQKAGQNMEHTLIAAYVAMLIGYLIIDNEEYEKFVRIHLPEKNFQFMISVLQKFYSFMTLTASGGTVSNRGMKSIQMVIQKLIESDQRNGYNSQTIPHPEGSENKNTETAPGKVVETQGASDRTVSVS